MNSNLPTDNLHNMISKPPSDSADITNTIHADKIEIQSIRYPTDSVEIDSLK